MVRSPQFYEWFPFWRTFCEHLGIDLKPAAKSTRKQFEAGSRFLPVETCLPMKAMAGQIKDLVDSGAHTLFHTTVLIERYEASEQRRWTTALTSRHRPSFSEGPSTYSGKRFSFRRKST